MSVVPIDCKGREDMQRCVDNLAELVASGEVRTVVYIGIDKYGEPTIGYAVDSMDNLGVVGAMEVAGAHFRHEFGFEFDGYE